MKIKCGKCRFWRFKSSGEDNRSFGICDNLKITSLIGMYCLSSSLTWQDIRTEENFGCIFAEKLEAKQ